MKTTARLFTASVVAVLMLHTALGLAGVHAHAVPVLVSAASLGAGEAPEADELVKKARAAMEAGDLKAADKFIADAEKKSRPGLFQLGDTPKKARADLEKLKASAGAGKKDMLPSQRFAQNKPSGPAGVKDPFLARPQTEPAAAPGAETKSRAQAFLANGRKELADNNLTAAAHWHREAAELGVIFAPSEDSPAKLAAEIQRRGGKVEANPGSGYAALPPVAGGLASMAAAPAGAYPNTQAAAPLARATAVTPAEAAADGGVQRTGFVAPPLSGTTGLTGPNGSPSSASAAGGDARMQSDRLLLGARKAMANGDVRRAMSMCEQAKTLKLNYGLIDDSPAKVEALIRKHADLISRDTPKDSETYRHQYADLLLEQAEALRRWKDYDEAERLATDAQGQRANFGPFETKPEALLEKIHAERNQARVGGGGAQQFSVDVEAPRSAPVAQRSYAGTPAPTAPVVGGPVAGGPAAGGMTQPAAGQYGAPTNGMAATKAQAVELNAMARAAMARGDLQGAERLAQQSESLVPDSAYSPGEDRSGMILLDVRKARAGMGGVVQTSGVMNAAGATNNAGYPGAQTLYDRTTDTTRNVPVAAAEPRPFGAPESLPVTQPREVLPGNGDKLYQQGMQQLRDGKSEAAYDYFRQAWDYQAELDPLTRSRLQEQLQMMAGQAAARRKPAGGESLADAEAAKQQLLAKQVSAEAARQQSAARALMDKDPRRALETLKASRTVVEAAGLEPVTRDQLLRRVDASIAETQKYMQDNLVQIEHNQKNKDVHAEVAAERAAKVEVGEKLALLVNDYNKLIDERRYAEAEVLAKKAREMDPKNPIVVQLINQSRALRRVESQNSIASAKEEGVWGAFNAVDDASTPFNGEIAFPKNWKELTKDRARLLADGRTRRTERDVEIERKLTTPVSMKFNKAPLSEVMNYLAKLAQVNLYLDPQGMAAEGVTSDTTVTIDLSQDVMLKSALKLVLEPLHLSYVIKDEVLKITSEQTRHGEVYTKTYPVADLIIPIPNFVPGLNGIGLDRAIQGGYDRMRNTAQTPFVGAVAPVAVAANDTGANTNAKVNPQMLAQMQQRGLGGLGNNSPPVSGSPQNLGFGGPGGLGGGSQADFDSLIELVTSTIQPTTWTEVGGQGSIKGFDTNLSLVVSQTQDIHEEIADLLQQLRRLQDLQVTIEVRFITLRDDFFERIGLDFDFNVRDRTGLTSTDIAARRAADSGPSITVGLDATRAITPDLNLQFSQGSFDAAVPPFANDPTSAATFGFAILSDIEAFFLIQAAQGDSRTNILQAPKVTLFNGQQAFVSDTSQRPFVTSVVPVVGDFAAAQQPVIVVLSEGTSLTVQAVVSNDRRFVRLTVVPFFSQIGDVQEFTFTGTTSTTRASSSTVDDADNEVSEEDLVTQTTEGTTVQLPTFSFVTVTTTVSVPDGGTVLLGGIKRLSEGRNERGVPVLSKLPYINRLFKNVGIGRTTTSLMMMVTPRIIIQEEEEEKLIGETP